MKLPAISTLLLLPLLVVAQDVSSTTTITSTATSTRTVTVSRLVSSVTSTLAAYNSTISVIPTPVGTSAPITAAVSITSSAKATASPTPTIPSNYMGAASSLSAMYAGGAGLLVMFAASLL